MEIAEIEAMFKHLGLKRYESKAMITLLSYGKCTADQVTSFSGIPLPRVYDTMNTLAKRGFISVSKTRPEIFRAIDPKRLFMLLEAEEKKKLDNKLKDMNSIIPHLLKHIKRIDNGHRDETEDVLAVVKKRVNLRKDREDFHNLAKKEILVFAGDLSWIKNAEDVIKDTIKKGVKYKVIYCKKGKSARANARKFKNLGATVRFYSDTGSLRCWIFDKKSVSMTIKKYKIPEDYEYSLINVTNSKIADVFARYFYSVWEKAK